MSTSFPTTTTVLFSDHFLESSGVITFNSQSQICLLYNPLKQEYLLPKGRCNVNESRSQAALREFTEETGWTCTILPVTMRTRATMQEDQGYDSRGAVRREGVMDPFAVSIREEGAGRKKFIWWFLGVVWVGDREGGERRGVEDLGREVLWVGVEEAVGLLSFESDREVVRKAHELYEITERGDGGDDGEDRGSSTRLRNN